MFQVNNSGFNLNYSTKYGQRGNEKTRLWTLWTEVRSFLIEWKHDSLDTKWLGLGLESRQYHMCPRRIVDHCRWGTHCGRCDMCDTFLFSTLELQHYNGLVRRSPNHDEHQCDRCELWKNLVGTVYLFSVNGKKNKVSVMMIDKSF